MRKSGLFLMLFLLIQGSSQAGLDGAQGGPPIKDRNERIRRIFLQGGIVNEGIDYFRDFKFDLAAEKLIESTKPQYLNEDTDKSLALTWLSQLYKEMGRYEEALKVLEWYHEKSIDTPKLKEMRGDLEARMRFQNTGNKEAVGTFISWYKKQRKQDMPPKSAKALVMSTLAELYDLIGDYDAGIAWVMLFKKKIWWDADKKTKTEYNNLIQAFEESKRGMPKVCSDDGKYCVGRATAVIIRSKYF